jgi:hypothetical protein
VTSDQPIQPPGPVPGSASPPPPADPAPAATDAEPAGSSTEWKVNVSDDHDRWTLSLPANTLQKRYLSEYFDKHQKDPPSLNDLPQLPKYVKVTATRTAGRKNRSVLKTKLIQGGGEQCATIAAAAFGPNVISISLAPSNQLQFRLARLNTPANRLNVAAVILGAASAVITVIFTVVIGAPQPGQSPSDAVLAWAAIAAAAAVAAPLLALASNTWFSD